MRGFVANTDHAEFTFLRSLQPSIDEVNFWRPGTDAGFRALAPGEPFFFRLKAPDNAIGGFGFFAHFSVLPVSVAWDAYGAANGASTYAELRQRLSSVRGRLDMEVDAKKDFAIGCILVNEPRFFADGDWVRVPDDWSATIVQGKTYDLTVGEGKRMWMECLARTGTQDQATPDGGHELLGKHGTSVQVRPRLGPRSFRIVVLDAYERRCVVTGERALPALEAAHIRQYEDVAEHSVNNGLLFRADIRKLFEAGYVTVTPDLRFLVSRSITDDFENGDAYRALHGTQIRLPLDPEDRPLPEALWWHNEERFLG